MEGAVGGSSALSPAAVGGRRRSRKGVKTHLRLVKKKTVRKMLAKKGLRMRGGASAEPAAVDGVAKTGEVVKDAAAAPALGGRRHRKTAGRRKSRRSRKVFGLF